MKTENLKHGGEYELVEISNGVKVASHRINAGKKKVKTNEELEVLKRMKQQMLAKNYNQERNYPNPFNPSAIIEFSMPEKIKNMKLSDYNGLS